MYLGTPILGAYMLMNIISSCIDPFIHLYSVLLSVRPLFFFFLSTPRVCGSSWARNHLCHRCGNAGFLTHCTSGQGLNPCCHRDNTRSLCHCATVGTYYGLHCKVYFVWYEYCYSYFLVIFVCMKFFSHLLTFNLCASFALK